MVISGVLRLLSIRKKTKLRSGEVQTVNDNSTKNITTRRPYLSPNSNHSRRPQRREIPARTPPSKINNCAESSFRNLRDPAPHSITKQVKMLDNANPTILSVSELPTRRQRRQRKEQPKKGGIRDMFYGKPEWEMDPYYTLEYSDADSDDSAIEPIDEQEIYGQFIQYWTSFILRFSNLPMSNLSCLSLGVTMVARGNFFS